MSVHSRYRSFRRVIVCLLLFAGSSAFAQDFIFGDDFDATLDCTGAPSPGIAGVISPGSRATTLMTANHYFVKLISCGYQGAVTLTPGGVPASWTTGLDPDSLQLGLNGSAVAELILTVPSNGDSGNTLFSVSAQSSTNTAPLSASLDVAKQIVVTFPLGTGSGDHQQPPFLNVQVGTVIRVINADTTVHRVEAGGGAGFAVQAPPGLNQGQEYDLTATDTTTAYFFYCHTHFNIASETHVNSN